MISLADIQKTETFILARWKLTEAPGLLVVSDDIGGVELFVLGTPTLGLPSFVKYDIEDTSFRGGTTGYFSAIGLTGFNISVAGLTLEGISAAERNGLGFNILSAPGQYQLQVDGSDVVFTVWIGSSANALTASSVLNGMPQHIVGVYDEIAQLQRIYVDSQQVASQTLAGTAGQDGLVVTTTCTASNASKTLTAIPSTQGMAVDGSISGPVFASGTKITSIVSATSIQISEFPTGSGAPEPITVGMAVTIGDQNPLSPEVAWAVAQDVAIYDAPLSAQRIAQHFAAFRQSLEDPTHVRVYPQIAVNS